MNPPRSAFRASFSLLAALWLASGHRVALAGESFADASVSPFSAIGSTGEISITNLSGGTTSVDPGGGLTLTGVTNHKVRTVVPTVITGCVDPLQISANADGITVRIKTKVSLTNSGKKAKNAAADVYLSDDDFLDASDVKLTTVKLTDFVPDATKILKGETLTLPIHRKVARAMAASLEGKYLIAVLSAETTTLTDDSIVAGILRPVPNLYPKTTTVSAGTPVTLNASSGFALNYLTAATAATLQVGLPLGQDSGTAPPVVGIRYRADSWLYIEPGTTVDIEFGDRLSIYPGYTLKMISAETWTTSSGNYLVVAPGGEVADPAPTTASQISRPDTPVNQVIIGPIHLP